MPVPTRNVIYPIYSPARGLVMNAPSPYLDPRASPDCQNTRFYDSIVEKRTGYPSAAYAAGTITGVPIKLYSYTDTNGKEYEILTTTTNIYYNNDGTWASFVGTSTSEEFLVSTGWTSTGWTGSFSAGWTFSTGVIATTSLNSGGINYLADLTGIILQEGHNGSAGVITINTVDGSGTIQTYTLSSGGANYTVENGVPLYGAGQGGKINILTVSNAASVLSQSKAAISGTEYRISYVVTGRTAGTFTIAFGGLSQSDISTTGFFEGTASSTANLTITPTETFDGTIVVSIVPILPAEEVDLNLNIEDRISLNTMWINSKFYLVVGSKNYAGHKWDGAIYSTITSTAVYKPRILLPYQFRLLLFNIDEDGTNFPIKFRYTVANPTNVATDWTATGSGSRNMIQGMGTSIMNALSIKDYVGVYKDKSISVLDYVGGSSIFATAVHIDGIGLLATDAIVNLGTSHLFLGSDYNIYEWNGGWELIPIGNAVKKYIKDNIYKTNKLRCFATANFERTEAHFFIPIGEDEYPTRFLTYNWTDKTWALNTCSACSGGGNLNTSGVEKTIFGLSAGTVHNYDYSSTNDGAAAIDSYFTTPDVTIDKEEYKIKMKDFKNIYVDAKGNNLSMYYSTDEGSTWSTVDTDALESTSIYNLHAFNYAAAARNIRFKFANATASESYAVRFVGIEHKDIKQSGRK